MTTRHQSGAGFSASDAEKSTPRTVLIVEDEPLIRWSLKATLDQTGEFRVLEADNAAGALACVSNGSPPVELVFLDLRLPDSDGLDVLKAIKRAQPRCRVILMTAYSSHELRAEAHAAGAYRTVTKPFSMDHMATLARRVLSTAPS